MYNLSVFFTDIDKYNNKYFNLTGTSLLAST